MYIELFILDNLVMDALILRLASAFCAAPVKFSRILFFSLLGAGLAFASLVWEPLVTLPGKLLTAMLMALAFPVKGFASYLRALAAMFGAALLVGGFAFALALADGGGFTGGALVGSWKLRTALIVATAAAFAPYALRRFRMNAPARIAKVTLVAGGKEHRLRGLWDTGARLYEPVSGLPVVTAYLPALAAEANIPVPASTVTGDTILFALKPDALFIDGRASDALVAPLSAKLRGADAIIPYRIFGEAR
ncbi:MAG TPA: sigma-E processing peptidase SpoIIGA [Clostridia bacterium]|nr:sigma-E processing peptidase SpoIIGA [Clostridia bacterium]